MTEWFGLGGTLGMIPFQPIAMGRPLPTAPVCSKAHPAWPWITDRSWFCQSKLPWHNLCFHRRLPLCSCVWNNSSRMRPGLFAKFHPARLQAAELPTGTLRDSEILRTGGAVGMGAPWNCLQELPFPSRLSALRGLSPDVPQERQTGVGQDQSSARAPNLHGRHKRARQGGNSSPCSCLRAQFSFQEQRTQSPPAPFSLLIQRSACNNSPLYSPVGKPPLLACPPCSNELSLQKTHQSHSICNIVINRYQHFPSTTA